MSLEAIIGTPLDQRPAVSQRDKGRRIKNPQRIPQRGTNWCWAASIQSARLTIGEGVRQQHVIVADRLSCGRSRCCKTPTDTDCDQTIDRAELEDLWRKEDFSQMTYALRENRPVDFDDVKDEIANGRLVLLELNNQHVILVYGWRVDSLGVEIVQILDTVDNPPSESNFKDLDTYDGSRWGPWTGTGLGIEFDGPFVVEVCDV